MTVAIPVADARIIGAMAQPRSKAVFSRAALLVSNDDGVVLHAHAYGQAGLVSGPRLTLEDVRVLVATGQAIDLPRREILAVGAVLWILRPGFPRRAAEHGHAPTHASGDASRYFGWPDGTRTWVAINSQLRDQLGSSISKLCKSLNLPRRRSAKQKP